MSLWLVRAGSSGQNEEVALKNNFVPIGWNQLPDLSRIKSKEEIKELLTENYQGKSKHAIANYGGLAPTIYQSGNVTNMGRINRDGR